MADSGIGVDPSACLKKKKNSSPSLKSIANCILKISMKTVLSLFKIVIILRIKYINAFLYFYNGVIKNKVNISGRAVLVGTILCAEIRLINQRK